MLLFVRRLSTLEAHTAADLLWRRRHTACDGRRCRLPTLYRFTDGVGTASCRFALQSGAKRAWGPSGGGRADFSPGCDAFPCFIAQVYSAIGSLTKADMGARVNDYKAIRQFFTEAICKTVTALQAFAELWLQGRLIDRTEEVHHLLSQGKGIRTSMIIS